MRHVYGNAFATTNEMQGQYRHGKDIFVPPFKWAKCLKVLVDKPAATLAFWGSVDERTAKRWIAGEFPLPLTVWIKMQEEMLKREGQ